MSKLSFKCDFKSRPLQSLTLPVEVRKPNMALVAQTFSNRVVDVAPGTYYVSVKLPAGQELYDQVIIVEGQERSTAFLKMDPEDITDDTTLEMQRYIRGQPADALLIAKGIENFSWGNTTAKLRVFEGNALQSKVLVGDASAWFHPLPASVPEATKFECQPGKLRFAQLLQSEAPPINVVLPVSFYPPHGCQLILTRQANDLLSIEAHPEHIDAEALLQYYEKGLLEQAAMMAKSDALRAERLVEEKMGDPIAASIGAYTLLRLGELERLHTWTENLKNWFEWLPDGIPIRAEHLARLGQHDQAMKALLDLSQRGLPIFSDGLSYAINRLRLYVSYRKSGYIQEVQPQATALLEKLQQFANFVDFRQPILTFTGLDPNKPDDEPFAGDMDHYEGLDLAP